MLGFSRLSAAAYGVIQRAIDDDGIFRARVAAEADEELVGRAGWLWLHRPVGWADDDVFTGPETVSGAVAPSSGRSAKADREATAKHRRAAAEAEAARKQTAAQLAELRREAAALRVERDALAADIATAREERHGAIRRTKALEAELAAARRDLKLARAATRQAEAELLARRKLVPEPVVPSVPEPVPAPITSAGPSVDPAVQAAVAASVHDAARAAADLAAALSQTAAALAAPPAPPASPAPPAPAPPKSKGTSKGARKPALSAHRRLPHLPPGVFDGTPEAHRHLLGSSVNLLVVDGYNLARAAWGDLAPEEERRRTVALLDDVQARSGGRVIVVFDGDDAVVGPKASKTVRVLYSATGQTADDAIVDLLAATPATQPAVVVSSDRAVVADARRQGAATIGSQAFLRAAGR